MAVDNSHNDKGSPETLHSDRAKRWMILAPLLVLCLLVGGYFGIDWWIYSLRHVSTDDARVKGTLVTVSSKVSGRLLSLLVEEGQPIKKGGIIARIQQEDYKAQVELHEAALEAVTGQLRSAMLELELAKALAAGHLERSDAALGASQSQLTAAEKAAVLESQRTKADVREKEAALEEAKARLTGAKVAQDMAAADQKRLDQLFRDGIVAAEQRDQAAAAYDQAVAAYQSALEAQHKNLALLERARAESRRVQLLLANVSTQQRKVRESVALKSLAEAEQQRVKMKEEEVKTLRAKIKEAQARLALTRMQLAETVITSPVNGVVSQIIADAGEHVQVGQPIAIVNDPQDVWVEANVEETYIRKVQTGQLVDIDVDAFPQRKFEGKVIQIGAATRSEFAIIPAGSASAHFIKVTQRLPVKIAVDNRDGLLKPGMMAVVGIQVKED